MLNFLSQIRGRHVLGLALLLALFYGGFYFWQKNKPATYRFDFCPVLGIDCQKFRTATDDTGTVVGFGYSLSSGTKVYSPVFGKLSFDKISVLNGKGASEDMLLVHIADPRGYLISYYFKGVASAAATFDAPAGTSLGQTEEGITHFDSLNLVIEIRNAKTQEILLPNPKALLQDAKTH